MKILLSCVVGSQPSAETEAPPAAPRRCAWLYNSEQALTSNPVLAADEDVDEDGPEERGVENGRPYVQCTKASNACFTAWNAEHDGNQSTVVFIKQGESVVCFGSVAH